MISCAATRPPPFFLSRDCEIARLVKIQRTWHEPCLFLQQGMRELHGAMFLPEVVCSVPRYQVTRFMRSQC